MYLNEPLVHAFVFLCVPRLSRSPASHGPVMKQRDKHGLPAPTWAVIHLVKLLSPVHPRANLYFHPIRRLAVLPIMVPLNVEHVEGGRDAEAAVTQQLMCEMEVRPSQLSGSCLQSAVFLSTTPRVCV